MSAQSSSDCDIDFIAIGEPAEVRVGVRASLLAQIETENSASYNTLDVWILLILDMTVAPTNSVTLV